MLEGSFNLTYIRRVPYVKIGVKEHFLAFFMGLLSH